MTDEEIIETLKRADALLAQYEAIVQPAVDELARRKSIAVYAKDGQYTGDLGCHEEGINTLCLHRKRIEDTTYEEDKPREDAAFEFDSLWGTKARAAGITHLYVTGYF